MSRFRTSVIQCVTPLLSVALTKLEKMNNTPVCGWADKNKN